MKQQLVPLCVLSAVCWGVGCRADENNDNMTAAKTTRLPQSTHARVLPKDSTYITVRVHSDGRVDLDTRSVTQEIIDLLKDARVELDLKSVHESLSLDGLRTHLREAMMLFEKAAARAGKSSTIIKNKFGRQTSTLEVRYEFHRDLELGRAVWILTTGALSGLNIGWVVVHTKEGDPARGISADSWHRVHRRDPGEPETSPVLATVVMRGRQPGGQGEARYRFAGRPDADKAGLIRDVKSAGQFLRRTGDRPFAVAVVAASTATVQQYVELADAIASTGVAELAFTPVCRARAAVRAASKLPVHPNAVLVLDVLLALELEEESPVETEDRELLALTDEELAGALLAFPADAPRELRDWKRPTAFDAGD